MPIAESTRIKMREAKVKANDTERRYKLLTESIAHGDTLCFRDYAFYRRYCQRNGIEFAGCKVDKTSKTSTIDFQKPPKPTTDPTDSAEFLAQVHRYRVLKTTLAHGHIVTNEDKQFILEFCEKHGWQIPDGIG